MDTGANALQALGRNDNGWDQGQLFYLPNATWLSPYGWAQRMIGDAAASVESRPKALPRLSYVSRRAPATLATSNGSPPPTRCTCSSQRRESGSVGGGAGARAGQLHRSRGGAGLSRAGAAPPLRRAAGVTLQRCCNSSADHYSDAAHDSETTPNLDASGTSERSAKLRNLRLRPHPVPSSHNATMNMF